MPISGRSTWAVVHPGNTGRQGEPRRGAIRLLQTFLPGAVAITIEMCCLAAH